MIRKIRSSNSFFPVFFSLKYTSSVFFDKITCITGHTGGKNSTDKCYFGSPGEFHSVSSSSSSCSRSSNSSSRRRLRRSLLELSYRVYGDQRQHRRGRPYPVEHSVTKGPATTVKPGDAAAAAFDLPCTTWRGVWGGGEGFSTTGTGTGCRGATPLPRRWGTLTSPSFTDVSAPAPAPAPAPAAGRLVDGSVGGCCVSRRLKPDVCENTYA
jgi:hypothetical protein